MQIPLLIAAIVAVFANSETTAPQQETAAQQSTPVQTELSVVAPQQATVAAEETGRYIKPLEPIFASQLLAQPMEPIQLASIEPLAVLKEVS